MGELDIDLESGVIGKYRILQRLGEGATSEVFLCRDDFHNRNVAIKRVRAAALVDAVDGPVYARFFAAEAALVGRLQHPNVVQIYDAVPDPVAPYVVMEYVPGTTLRAYCRPDQLLPLELIVELGFKCAMALGYVYRQGLIHRDVKPANILVREDGVVKLTDFGIARALDASGHTQHGEMLGTPNYISPEQAIGEQATGASDLYALGVVAHEMLTGTRPFDRGTPIATALSHVNEPPPPLGDDVPADLREVVELLLDKDPTKRPANAHDVATMLGLGAAEMSGVDLDLAAGVPSVHVGMPLTPVTPLTPVRASRPAGGSAALDEPTVAARPEDLLD